MVWKRKMKTKKGGICPCRPYIRPRLGQTLMLVFFLSVGLNVFLLFFRNAHLLESEKSADESSHLVFDNWAAGYEHSDNKITQQRLEMNSVKKDEPGNIKKRNTESHVHQQMMKFTKVKQTNQNTSTSLHNQKDVLTLSKKLPKCSLSPPTLVGQLRALTENIGPQALRQLFPHLEKGGRIRPTNCNPRERLAIVIPFRNRHQHLHIFLHNLIPFLQRQMTDATIFVIEQAPPTTFNRGALLNIGFLEAQKVANFDCFVFHDVDLIPLNDRNFYRCGKNPRHYAVAINKFKFRLSYETYFGGVVGFSRKQYLKVNGNSNLHFGWGGEDDDLWNRTTNKNFTIDRYDNITSRYLMIKHTRDKGNDKNTERRKIMKSSFKRQDIEGLNTTKYKVNSIKLDNLYTWINVSLDMKEIFETAPIYTRHDIWKLMKDLKLLKLPH